MNATLWRAATVTLAVAGVTVALLASRRRRVAETVQEYESRVTAGGAPPGADPYHPDDVTDLPPPVRRYLEAVLSPGQRPVAGARLAQTGEFALGGDWHPFTASQAYAVSPPGYVWDADIELFPGVSARVMDAYVEGEGLLRASLLGAVPVASAGPDPRMNEAELQRYLSETPWFPTALLPAAGVTWEAIDENSARATVRDGDVSASVVFEFGEEGYVRRLTADRYRQDTDGYAPWVGRYRGYEERDGLVIPTEGEVAWETPEGEKPYWRGAVTGVDYRFD
jgi:hypothetical protein